jgi:hypothetical protein
MKSNRHIGMHFQFWELRLKGTTDETVILDSRESFQATGSYFCSDSWLDIKDPICSKLLQITH